MSGIEDEFAMAGSSPFMPIFFISLCVPGRPIGAVASSLHLLIDPNVIIDAEVLMLGSFSTFEIIGVAAASQRCSGGESHRCPFGCSLYVSAHRRTASFCFMFSAYDRRCAVIAAFSMCIRVFLTVSFESER